ncbi:hypothetical protein LABOLPEG_00005 [Pseudomonas phage phi 21A]|nr:hypothetical protein LABOLPEG_00005 [Pseudomonas phage phi 21A]
MILVKSTPDIIGEAAFMASSGDRAEFNKMIAGRDMTTVLLGSLDETSMSIVHNGQILATGGSSGCLWFITTKHVDNLTPRERLDMLALLKDHLETCRATMDPDLMTNMVWTGNHQHIRLLKHLGARFAEHTVLSPAGYDFRQFWL